MDLQEHLARQEHQEELDRMDQRVHLVVQALVVTLELEDRLEWPDHKAHKVQLVILVKLDLLVQAVRWEFQVTLVHQDQLDHLDPQVLRDLRVPEDRKELKVLLEPQVQQVWLDRLEHLVQWELPVNLAALEHLD